MSIPNYLTSRSVNSVQTLVNYSDNSVQVSAAPTSDYTTFGQTWTQTSAPNAAWYALSTSVNGQYLSACAYGGQIYTSINYGQAWTAVATSQNWTAIAVSSSGQYQVATVANGAIYYSSNYGSTWTASATSGTTALNWSAIAISASGQYVCAAVNGGAIWYSSNNGVAWTVSNSGTSTWTGIAISSVGNYVTACAGLNTAGTSGTGSLYYSTNFGQTWTASATVGTTALTWTSVTMSASGQNQTASVTGGSIWYSSTYGQTWIVSNAAANTWKSMSMSASGLYGLVTTNATSTGSSTVNSLLYNYRFNTTDVLGTQLLDFASGLYDAFMVNGATITSSIKQVGTGGLSLTSTNAQYVVLPPFQMTSAIQTSGLTIAGWIKPITTTSGVIFHMTQSNLASGYITGTGTGYSILITFVSGLLYYYLQSATSSTATVIGNYYYNSSISTSAWTHVAVVLTNGSAPTLYINGSAVSFTVNAANTLLPLPTYLGGVYPYIALGASGTGTSGYFNGYMDEFRFYTSALTAAQVSAVWNSGSGIIGLLQYTTNMGQTWTTTTGIHANYQAVAMSANGQFLAACVNGGGIFTSLVASAAVSTSSSLTVSGATSTGVLTYQDGSTAISAQAALDYSTFAAAWTVQPVLTGAWTAVAMSTTGQYIVACINAGYMWYSMNYGQSWLSGGGYSSSGMAWTAVAISATGQYGVAAVNAGSIYYSSNYGVLWTTTGLANSTWTAVAVSASGAYMLAAASSGYLWYSTNYGTTWAQSGSISTTWSAVALSASGQYAIAAVNGGYIWMSSNYGVTWVQTGSASYNWSSVAMSASGQYATAAVGVNTSAAAAAGFLFYSANYGATWTQTGASNFWKTVIMSASGQYQLATTNFPSLLVNYRFATTDVQGVNLLDYGTGQYNAQLVNGATISTAAAAIKVGAAGLALTAASSQYAQLAPFTMTSAMQTSGITVAGWVNLSATSAINSHVFDISGALKLSNNYITGGGTCYTYTIGVNTVGSQLYFSNMISTSTSVVYNGSSILTVACFNAWAHITWVMNPTNWQIYINGTIAATYSSLSQSVYVPPITYNTGLYPYVFLGRSSGIADPYATGYWNDFRMYSTALSAAQISAIYNSGTLGTLQYSNNFGQSWSSTTGTQANYSGLTMSSTGQYMVGCVNSGNATGSIYGSVTSNGPMATSGNMTVGGVLTAPVRAYADGSVGITAGSNGQLDYTSFGQNWTTVSLMGACFNIAMSATGQYQTVVLVSTSNVYYSSNYGQSWTLSTGIPSSIVSNAIISISASGQYQVTGAYSPTASIYVSSTYGTSWTTVPTISLNICTASCVSASGQYMSMASSVGAIYISNNYGVSWTSATSGTSQNIQGMCCSASGQYQSAAINNYGCIYSNNYGATWTLSQASGSANYNRICCSASGQYQYMTMYNVTGIYYSINYGQTWMQSNITSGFTSAIACSASGQYVVVAAGTTGAYYSTNYGQTYALYGNSVGYSIIAMSADAKYITASYYNINFLHNSILREPTKYLNNSVNAMLTYADGSAQVSAGAPLDYTTFGQNWATMPINGITTGNWNGICTSASGQYVSVTLRSATIYYSSNYGQSWTASNAPTATWYTVACSASGQYQTAVSGTIVSSSYYNYYSNDYGRTWTASSTPFANAFTAIAVSASGQYQTTVCNIGGVTNNLYISSNYGVTWTVNPLSVYLYMVAMSASGQYQTVAANGTGLYYSTNYGQSWTISNAPSYQWLSVSISASGQYQSASNNSSSVYSVYYSTNYGVTWTASTSVSTTAADNVCISASGQYQILNTVNTTNLYYSINYGVTWTTLTMAASAFYYYIAMSANGQYIYMTAFGGNVYASTTRSPSLFTSGSIILGNSANTQNQPQLVYNQVGAGSTSNYAAAGFLSNANTLCWTANGNVGIGTTNPSQALQVLGNTLTSGFLHTNNTATGTPTIATYGGTGDRIILYTGSVTVHPYSLGINAGTMWYSVPTSSQHQWLIGGNSYMTLSSSGLFALNGALNYPLTNAATQIYLSDSANTSMSLLLGARYVNSSASYASLQGSLSGVGPTYLCLNPAGGNVGIGSTNPQYTLDVAGTARVSSLAFNGGSQTLTVGTSGIGSSPYLYSNYDLLIGWSTNPSGNGYNDVTYNNYSGITLRGSLNSSSIMCATSYIPFIAQKYGGSPGTMIQFFYSSAIGTASVSVGTISHNTSSVAYNTTSDQRLKENIQDVSDIRGMMDKLRPRTFTFIADENKEVNIGFIAQEVQVNYPHYISGKETDIDFLQMDYGKMSPFAIAACKDLYRLVDVQAAQITTLETQMAQLMNRLSAAGIA